MAVELYPHQGKISARIKQSITDHSFAILQAPERCGKTLSVIDAVEQLSDVKRALWITKKAAIDGIKGDLKLYEAVKHYDVVNYEAIHKYEGDYDLIVADEFHYAISSFPKTPAKAQIIKDRWGDVPKILISATPAPESPAQWFHPLWLCSGHPFSRHQSFYKWAKAGYVHIRQNNFRGIVVNDYSNATRKVMDEVLPYIIQLTRDDLPGFDHKPVMVPHYVELNEETKDRMRYLLRHRVLGEFFADTPLKVVNGLYQIECGSLKIGDGYIDQGNREIMDYIKAHWGDTPDVAIMTRWVGQRRIFEAEFKNALILSSHAHAEGVELSHIEHLIIASMDYSTARFQQRNARQASKKRTTPINVHIIMSRGSVSEAVFEAVGQKHKDFTARMFLG